MVVRERLLTTTRLASRSRLPSLRKCVARNNQCRVASQLRSTIASPRPDSIQLDSFQLRSALLVRSLGVNFPALPMPAGEQFDSRKLCLAHDAITSACGRGCFDATATDSMTTPANPTQLRDCCLPGAKGTNTLSSSPSFRHLFPPSHPFLSLTLSTLLFCNRLHPSLPYRLPT